MLFTQALHPVSMKTKIFRFASALRPLSVMGAVLVVIRWTIMVGATVPRSAAGSLVITTNEHMSARAQSGGKLDFMDGDYLRRIAFKQCKFVLLDRSATQFRLGL